MDIVNKSQAVSVFNSAEAFNQAQRMVAPLVASTMVPEAYKNNHANCLVAMEMSHRLGKSVLEVMQNMQIVKGNVGWKSEYVISEINRSGLFLEPLEFVFSEDRQSCYAIAVRRSNNKELRGTTVTMAMAKDEGWLGKLGSKWKTMPEQMMMYRAATFFCRVHCPEVLAGVQTADEIFDIDHVEVQDPSAAISGLNEKLRNAANQQPSGANQTPTAAQTSAPEAEYTNYEVVGAVDVSEQVNSGNEQNNADNEQVNTANNQANASNAQQNSGNAEQVNAANTTADGSGDDAENDDDDDF